MSLPPPDPLSDMVEVLACPRRRQTLAQLPQLALEASSEASGDPLVRHCHVWTPPVLQGENRFETAVELAVMYPAFALRYADRWP